MKVSYVEKVHHKFQIVKKNEVEEVGRSKLQSDTKNSSLQEYLETPMVSNLSSLTEDVDLLKLSRQRALLKNHPLEPSVLDAQQGKSIQMEFLINNPQILISIKCCF